MLPEHPFPGPVSKEAAKTTTLSFPRTMLLPKQLTVTKVEQVNHDTKKITLSLPGGSDEISGVPAGGEININSDLQTPGLTTPGAILTQHTPSGRWFPVLRPYTPISDADEHGNLQLLIKQYPNGAASTYMHSLRPGQELTVRGPMPGYTWAPSSVARDVLFIAGGAGITPMYSLTKSILRDPNDKSRIQLVWGVNGTRDIVLKDELESLQKQHPDRLRVTYCISGPERLAETLDDAAIPGKYRKGYVNQQVLREVTAHFKTGTWGNEKGTKVFLCGPPAMEKAIAGPSGVLRELGLNGKDVYKF